MNARDYYQSGQLYHAIKAIVEAVRQHPSDSKERGFLCELLLIAREWERADKHLDLLLHQNPDAILAIALWRQLLRAGQARDQFFSEGRVPEILEMPNELIKMYLQASIFLRENNYSPAQALLEQAEQARSPCKGKVNDEVFADFRDLDDRCPSVLEIFTTTGDYYWIPFSRIVRLAFFEPKSAVDLGLRRAHLETTNDGPQGEVYIPAVYHTLPNEELSSEETERLLLGRATDWQSKDGEPVLGMGQKMFMFDEKTITIMEIKTLVFEVET